MENSENEGDVPQIYLLGKTYLKSNEEFYIRNDSILHMAAGDRHTILITESGRAYAFGDNNSGQLGLGHTDTVEKVSCIKSLKFGDTGEKVLLAACGRESSIIATNRGSLYGFGSNNRCQLGFESDESTSIHPLPVKIKYFRSKISWNQISMGAEHTCALTDDGIVYIWGSNEDGQCGQTRRNNIIKIPKELRLEYSVIAISCGYYHTALINEDGQLFLFGNNTDRQLGDSKSDQYNDPLEASVPDSVKTVACGHQHTVVLTDKGDVYICGRGDRGQLGLGVNITTAEQFILNENLPEYIVDIAAGEGHTAAVGSKGDIYVFGDGNHRKLSYKTDSNLFEPCSIDKFKEFNVLKVVCGGCQTIILAEKNQILEPFYSLDDTIYSPSHIEPNDNKVDLSESATSALFQTTHVGINGELQPIHPPIKSTSNRINSKGSESSKTKSKNSAKQKQTADDNNDQHSPQTSTTSGCTSSSISSVPDENELIDSKSVPDHQINSSSITHEPLAKRDTLTSTTDSTNSRITTESQPGFFSRIFRTKSSQNVPNNTNKNSRTCSMM